MTWEGLNNAFAGRPAVLVGKGPSLDAWLAKGCPSPPNAVCVGINNVAWVVPNVPFSVSADVQMDYYAPTASATGTTCIRGVPYQTTEGEWIAEAKADGSIWFDAHTFNHETRLSQTREELAEHRRLYCRSSSANPGIHLAWYMGFASIVLIGMDGGTGRASALAGLQDRDPPPTYDLMREHVDAQCDRLWGMKWSRWG